MWVYSTQKKSKRKIHLKINWCQERRCVTFHRICILLIRRVLWDPGGLAKKPLEFPFCRTYFWFQDVLNYIHVLRITYCKSRGLIKGTLCNYGWLPMRINQPFERIVLPADLAQIFDYRVSRGRPITIFAWMPLIF